MENYQMVINNNSVQETEKNDKTSMLTRDKALSSLNLKVSDKIIVSQLSDNDVVELLSGLQEGIYSNKDSYYEVTRKKY